MIARSEYKVVPAPVKGLKAKGVKGAEARFALAVEQTINDLAAEGWEYVRTDVLPSEERQGLTGSVTQWRNLMVFRRAMPNDVDHAPVINAPTPAARVEPVLTAAPAVSSAVPEGPGVAEADAQTDQTTSDQTSQDSAEETQRA
ncbi:DUF4177 domain-containing protein [Marivita sp. S0852]|uniref:DUF4177 domain-containing protein n=1 Tax=Marivita sp. S0852 TaxID=3373893 RepID=UPI0039824547